jgi:hypothetical protein
VGTHEIDIAEQILPDLLAVIRDSVTANSPLEEFYVEDEAPCVQSLRFWRSEIDICFSGTMLRRILQAKLDDLRA